MISTVHGLALLNLLHIPEVFSCYWSFILSLRLGSRQGAKQFFQGMRGGADTFYVIRVFCKTTLIT